MTLQERRDAAIRELALIELERARMEAHEADQVYPRDDGPWTVDQIIAGWEDNVHDGDDSLTSQLFASMRELLKK